MDKLYRLPNGTWIQLTDVELIQPQQIDEQSYLIIVVHGIVTDHITLPFETYSHACDYGDEIAAMVNEAQRAEDVFGPIFTEPKDV